jgi:hypothetical protein
LSVVIVLTTTMEEPALPDIPTERSEVGGHPDQVGDGVGLHLFEHRDGGGS